MCTSCSLAWNSGSRSKFHVWPQFNLKLRKLASKIYFPILHACILSSTCGFRCDAGNTGGATCTCMWRRLQAGEQKSASYDQLSTACNMFSRYRPYTNAMDTIATAWRDPARKRLKLDMYGTRANSYMDANLHLPWDNRVIRVPSIPPQLLPYNHFLLDSICTPHLLTGVYKNIPPVYIYILLQLYMSLQQQRC